MSTLRRGRVSTPPQNTLPPHTAMLSLTAQAVDLSTPRQASIRYGSPNSRNGSPNRSGGTEDTAVGDNQPLTLRQGYFDQYDALESCRNLLAPKYDRKNSYGCDCAVRLLRFRARFRDLWMFGPGVLPAKPGPEGWGPEPQQTPGVQRAVGLRHRPPAPRSRFVLPKITSSTQPDCPWLRLLSDSCVGLSDHT